MTGDFLILTVSPENGEIVVSGRFAEFAVAEAHLSLMESIRKNSHQVNHGLLLVHVLAESTK